MSEVGVYQNVINIDKINVLRLIYPLKSDIQRKVKKK